MSLDIYDKLQNLLDAANETTGAGAEDLTEGVQALVDGYGTAPVIQSKTITENGTYTPPTGVDGFAPVVVNVQGGGGILPAGYTQLEYIESSGTQYIDLDYIHNMDAEYILDFYPFYQTNTYSTPFGIIGTDTMLTISTGNIGLITGVWYSQWGNSNEKSGQLPISTRWTMKVNKTGVFAVPVPNPTISYGSTSVSAAGHGIVLFARYNINTNIVERFVGMRCYRFTINENGVAVKDLIPAMKNDTQVIGLYDIVNDVFYENAGTGVFTGGALT